MPVGAESFLKHSPNRRNLPHPEEGSEEGRPNTAVGDEGGLPHL